MGERFILAEEHLALLRAVNWRWQDSEHGGPAVDGKRPFGFSHGLHGDMAAAVGWVYDEDDGEQEAELDRLWSETLTALLVGLDLGTFEPDEYVRDRAGWRRVESVDALGGAR